MSSESIVSALFLISAVIAAVVLINAIFPVITKTAGTFGSVSDQADTRMRTDIKIVNTFASGTSAKIWLKNIGTERISKNELDTSDIFIGALGDFERMSLEGQYTVALLENNWWDPGETLEIAGPSGTGITSSKIPASGDVTYFQIVLPNGVRRSEEFRAS